MKDAVFAGDYVDLKFIKSRKCAQIYIEIPIERAAEFVAAFGAPSPATGVPVAIARLNPDKPAPAPPPPDKERKSWNELSPSAQAAIRCNEPGFWKFLVDRSGYSCGSTDEAAKIVRHLCGVTSRSNLNTDQEAHRIWRETDIAYSNWQRGLE